MSFLGIDLFLRDTDDLISEILNNVQGKNKKCYFALNPECYLRSLDNNQYSRILRNSNHTIYVDGMGIIFTQKFLKLPVAKERIATTDLFPALIDKIEKEKRGSNIYLLGSKGDAAYRVIKKFSEKYRNVNFVGCHDGYFDEMREKEIINEINAKYVDILFVGFGCPNQEMWVENNFNKLNVNAFITCGGLFDYYSGNVKRAPKILQKVGLEWLYRLSQEPKRLYKRYIFGNIRYIFYMIFIKLKGVNYDSNRTVNRERLAKKK